MTRGNTKYSLPLWLRAVWFGVALTMLFMAAGLRAAEIPMANGSSLQGEYLGAEDGIARIRTDHGEVRVPVNSLDRKWLAAQSPAPSVAETDLPLAARVEVLEARIAALEATVQALRQELALARQSSPAEPPVAPAPKPDKAAAALSLSAPLPPPAAQRSAAVTTQTGHWLSTSGVRHNRSCRYYMKSKGQLSRPDEGRPCSKCGG